LCLQNERFIIRCIDELGFRLRDRIVWTKRLWISKTNSTIGSSMPTSANDRCAFSYEPVYVLVKSPRYYWDQDALEPLSKPQQKNELSTHSIHRKEMFKELLNTREHSILQSELIKGN